MEHYVQIGQEVLGVYRAMGYEPQNFYARVSHVKQLAELPFDEAVTMIDKLSSGVRGVGSSFDPPCTRTWCIGV